MVAVVQPLVRPSIPRPRQAPSPVLPPAAAPRRPGPEVLRRRRLVALAAAILALACIGLATRTVVSMVILPPAPASAEPPASSSALAAPLEAGEMYVVQPGDTLWAIATRLAPEVDPRITVDRLERARVGGPLRVGERIVLP